MFEERLERGLHRHRRQGEGQDVFAIGHGVGAQRSDTRSATGRDGTTRPGLASGSAVVRARDRAAGRGTTTAGGPATAAAQRLCGRAEPAEPSRAARRRPARAEQSRAGHRDITPRGLPLASSAAGSFARLPTGSATGKALHELKPPPPHTTPHPARWRHRWRPLPAMPAANPQPTRDKVSRRTGLSPRIQSE